MPDSVIKVENLSKRYRIGARESYRTFREALVDAVAAPFKRLWNLGRTASKEEDTIWALKDVSFEVQQGEVLGIIGRNGAGKSTLLKILSRITEPTEGRARIRGRVASLLEVGTGFHPELTGRENIFLNGAILGMSRAEIARKFDEIVAFAEIERFIDTPVKRYSSGMYVRLAFAVAAHLEPEVLLVDEVLAVGDGAFQKKCLGRMKNMTQEGRTVLFVSHNLYAVGMICPRSVWLDRGMILQVARSTEVISQYKQSVASAGADLCKQDNRDSEETEIISLRINGKEERAPSVTGTFDLDVDWDFRVRRPAEVAFGVSIAKADGGYICGLGTHLIGKTYALGEGIYRVGVNIPALTLESGVYIVRVSIMNSQGTFAYSYRSPAATVYVETPFHFDGLIGLRNTWRPPSKHEVAARTGSLAEV